MTTILPSARSSLDVIGDLIGSNLQQSMPGAIQQGFQRQTGMNALSQAEKDIANAGDDPFKIAMAFAKAGAQNPNLERSLGPLYQAALQQSRVKGAFGDQGKQPGSPGVMGTNEGISGISPEGIQQSGQVPEQDQFIRNPSLKSNGPTPATPSPFNIITPDKMDEESKRYAQVMNDPNAYNSRYAQLQNQNQNATAQRESLEDFALKSGVSPSDLPLFMKVGAQFDPRNPIEWARKSEVAWKESKNNMDKIDREFIPGIGSGLLGRDRQGFLKKMEGTVQDLVKDGLEQEVKDKLAANYLTPTEIGELVNPITPQKEKAIKSLPKGTFPFKQQTAYQQGLPYQTPVAPFISFEEAQEKAPKELQTMQNVLSKFFLDNVDENTSLLALRDKIIKDKDYDWRQFGPAVRDAMDKGLKLNKSQSAEMADIETQAPYDSLPYIFQSFDRFTKFLRGNK